jgi:hypothetical protein
MAVMLVTRIRVLHLHSVIFLNDLNRYDVIFIRHVNDGRKSYFQMNRVFICLEPVSGYTLAWMVNNRPVKPTKILELRPDLAEK